ncbi:MAG: hypothetical protein WCW47_01015 [Candidatus Paceibacterota bacterium]|jgi:hypothetical protein
MDKEKKITEKLFGSVDARRRVHDANLNSEDLEALTAPLRGEAKMEVINVFCVGHHSVFPISLDGRTELTNMAGAEVPASWDGKYFQVSSCPFCAKDTNFHGPVLKDFRM